MRLVLPVLSIIACFLSTTKVQAQWKQSLEQIRVNLDSFYQFNPLEKCFLHTDKDWYFPGETIWFRTYLTVDDEPGTLSKVIYVDLSNDSGRVITKSMWKNESPGNKGDLYLPRTTVPGLYRLRAYSLYMHNTPALIYEKLIRITDGVTSLLQAPTNVVPLQLHLQPEGGQLVAGLENRLGYFVQDAHQQPLQGAVVLIKDAAQTIVATDTASDQGLGALAFIPQSGKNYTATVSFKDKKQQYEVPPVSNTGVVLKANTGSNRIFVSLSTTAPQQYPSVLIVAQMHGIVVYAQEYPLQEGNASGAIDTRKLPEGILEISCLSKETEVLATRMVYVKKQEMSVISLQSKHSPQPKAPMEIQISGLPDSGSVSVAITDAEPVWLPQQPLRFSNYVHLREAAPGYKGTDNIFFQSSETSRLVTDLLLLVFGKSRFDMHAVISGRMPTIRYLPQTGIELQGKITSATPLPKESRVNLIVKTEDSTTIFTEALVLPGNRFAVGGLDFRKQARVYVKESSNRAGTTSITLESTYIDTLQQLLPAGNLTNGYQKISEEKASKADTSLQRFQYGKRQANELQEIIITGKTKTKEQLLTEQYATEQFRQSEFTLVPDSNIAYASIWQYLLATVAGLQVSGDFFTQPEVNFTRYTALRNFSGADATFVEDINGNRSSIAFYLNEVLVPIESITDLNPKDVALVKVNRNPNMGLNAPLGSIAIYTRKGSWWGRGDFNRSTITGYNTTREFFSPQYNTQDATLSTNDLRTTLYWNPALSIKNGAATIRFFNNDVSKRLKVVLCGMDATGKPIYFEQIIE